MALQTMPDNGDRNFYKRAEASVSLLIVKFALAWPPRQLESNRSWDIMVAVREPRRDLLLLDPNR